MIKTRTSGIQVAREPLLYFPLDFPQPMISSRSVQRAQAGPIPSAEISGPVRRSFRFSFLGVSLGRAARERIYRSAGRRQSRSEGGGERREGARFLAGAKSKGPSVLTSLLLLDFFSNLQPLSLSASWNVRSSTSVITVSRIRYLLPAPECKQHSFSSFSGIGFRKFPPRDENAGSSWQSATRESFG